MLTYDNASKDQDEDVQSCQGDFPCTRKPLTLVHVEPEEARDADCDD